MIGNGRLLELLPRWVAATRGVEVGFRLSSEEQNAQTRRLRHHLQDSARTKSVDTGDFINLDAVSAVCGILQSVNVPSKATLLEAECAFDTVSAARWPSGEFGEIPEVLCQIAFVAWRNSRALGLPERAYRWRRAFENSLRQPSTMRDCVHQFLTTLSKDQSTVLNVNPFLGPLTAYALCALLADQRDVAPRYVARTGRRLHALVGELAGSECWSCERDYFRGQTALLIAATERQLGNRRDAISWLTAAENHFNRIPNPIDLLADAAYTRFAIAHENGAADFVLTGIPELIRLYGSFGAEHEIARCRLLEASMLKTAGKIDDAVRACEALFATENLANEYLSLGLAISAELRTIRGDYAGALQVLDRLRNLLSSFDLPSATAHLQACVGEVMRQTGRCGAAIQVFSEARDSFARLGMVGITARVRLVLGETLLSVGRLDDAECELSKAVSVFREQRMMPEIGPAMALLEECSRRRRNQER